MNAFHPAVRGILEAALTQHQQARAIMRVAGDDTAETVERYSEIVDGLTRLISLVSPVGYGMPTVNGLEAMRASYLMVGRMMTALADIELTSWSFGNSKRDVDAMFSGRDSDARATISEIAERIGVPYVERRHGTTGTTLMIAAEGAIDGIAVRFWKLITAERPFCDRHHRMLTEADVCEQCENPGVDLDAAARAEVAEVSVTRVELVPAPRPDEDQPAMPARGHGQDDGDADLDFEFAPMSAEDYLDGDAPATHACSPRTGLARCGDPQDDPVFSNRPTCPTCQSLQHAMSSPIPSAPGAPDES